MNVHVAAAAEPTAASVTSVPILIIGCGFGGIALAIALKKAGIIVVTPSPALVSGMANIGTVIAKEWAASAGADGEAMLTTYRK